MLKKFTSTKAFVHQHEEQQPDASKVISTKRSAPFDIKIQILNQKWKHEATNMSSHQFTRRVFF